MKARLYKGPFAGKVVEVSGQPFTFVWTGPKKMSRKARYEWQRDMYADPNYSYLMTGRYTGYMDGPRVDATYRMMIQRGPYGNVPWTHPDGSVFYEFVSKKEYS